nr:TonB-dependent receptor [Pseudomaricurvus sp. HS19]
MPALALAAGFLSASAVHAQDGAPTSRSLEEVVVTATRREEGLQSIPASIAAVSGDDLQNAGITDFKSLTGAISGLDLVSPSSAIATGIYMRGVGTGGTSPAVSSVGVMVDDVYQIVPGVAFSEMFDVSRVEVLRGPQGTLFGKNTTAGVIRVYTNDPDTEEFSGKVQAVAGNYDAREVRGVVNVPLIEGKMGLRISGFNAEADGYTDNVFLNKDTRNTDREGYRVKWLWDVTDTFQVKLSAEDTNDYSRMDQSNVSGGVGTDGSVGYDIIQSGPGSLGKATDFVLGEVETDVERYIFNMRWDVLGHTLTTISAVEDITTYLKSDQTENSNERVLTPRPGGSYLENIGNRDIETHEIQWASDFDGDFSYLIGYYWQEQDSDSLSYIDGVLVSPTPLPEKSEAVFASTTYQFNDQWAGTVGVRYTEDERSGKNSALNPPAQDRVLGPNFYLYRPSSDLTVKTFRETTYSLKLTYQYDDDTMFYVAHDKGFKSGGVQREFGESCLTAGSTPPADWSALQASGGCIDPDIAFWEPETSYNYEFGIKSQMFDNTLRLNAALFYQTYEDFQVTQNRPDKNSVLVTNAAEVESMGLETEFTWLATDHLTFNGSLSYVQTEYDKYEDAPCGLTETSCDTGVPGNGTSDFSGRTLDHAPEWTFNVGAEYRDVIPMIDGLSWFGRMDVVYKDDQNLNVDQSREAEQDAYTLLNARLGIEPESASWRVTFWGKNLTDKEYLMDAGVATKGVAQRLAPPRTYGVTADYFF